MDAYASGAGSLSKDIPYQGAMYNITLAFGDSITQLGTNVQFSGWVNHLSQFFQRRMDVLNRGFNGYNTDYACNVAHLVLPRTKSLEYPTQDICPSRYLLPNFSPKVELLTICFGANDSMLAPGSKHVPLERFASNLRQLVHMVKDPESEYYSPDTRIVLITPPPVGDNMYKTFAEKAGASEKRDNKVTKLYADAARDVAQELDVRCIDLWTAIEDKVKDYNATAETEANQFDGYDQYLSDGLHLSAKGNELLFELVQSLVTTTWPELTQ
ncbi:isoamyl acetate-hydrolyzing esterase [Coemansia sp. RSA 1722]|nr:isoamyl acetate-hydrolyzing esterase [Coemansia sp. RSA 486]KAJ2606264.1 isoamyl acetate-hydrolyzing esterase [Coemansia sp. RSA 1722]